MENYKKQDEVLIIPCVSTNQTEHSAQNARIMTLSLDTDTQSSVSPTVTAVGMQSYNWDSGVMSEVITEGDVIDRCNFVSSEGMRTYMTLDLPILPRNPRIKRAELVLTQLMTNPVGEHARLGLYRVSSEITAGECTPAHESIPLDYVMARGVGEENVEYSFDITQ
ncbi:MAG: hypothetical protein IJE84_01390, partial [Clostridia bacterium]|nr:hypothetical protein [Clostridia bacterium]